jgi:hypothetical protein
MTTNIHFGHISLNSFLECKLFEANVVDKMITHILYSLIPPSPPQKNRAVYEIVWKSIREPGKPQMTIWRMHITCWIPKATNTHTGCLMLIAFTLKKWLHERASLLRYTYLACLFFYIH